MSHGPSDEIVVRCGIRQPRLYHPVCIELQAVAVQGCKRGDVRGPTRLNAAPMVDAERKKSQQHPPLNRHPRAAVRASSSLVYPPCTMCTLDRAAPLRQHAQRSLVYALSILQVVFSEYSRYRGPTIPAEAGTM